MRDVRFEVFVGQDAYDSEMKLIKRCQPSVNRAGTKRLLDPLAGFLDDADLATLFDATQTAADRLAACGNLLEGLAKSIGRTPYDGGKPWETTSNQGAGRRFGQRWTQTVYIGFSKDGDSAGIWAYTDDAMWFGNNIDETQPRTGEGPVCDREAFFQMAELFRDRWVGLDA
jgi:hypothetical protein